MLIVTHDRWLMRGLLGPVRMRVVEESQAKIVQVIRSLEESGQIMIRRGDDDEFVA